ncbi:MAG: LapA family protein [Actinobacteria bacterium]|nr:LapA family protein [Actinomycetota bacterium]
MIVTIILLLILLFIVIFSVQNSQVVVFSYLIGKANISLAVIIISSVLMGALLVAIIDIKRRVQLLKEINKQKAYIRDLENQLINQNSEV